MNMATITISNVPEKIVKQYGSSLEYSSEIKLPRLRRKNIDDSSVVFWWDDEINNMWKTSSISSNSF